MNFSDDKNKITKYISALTDDLNVILSDNFLFNSLNLQSK